MPTACCPDATVSRCSTFSRPLRLHRYMCACQYEHFLGNHTVAFFLFPMLVYPDSLLFRYCISPLIDCPDLISSRCCIVPMLYCPDALFCPLIKVTPLHLRLSISKSPWGPHCLRVEGSRGRRDNDGCVISPHYLTAKGMYHVFSRHFRS